MWQQYHISEVVDSERADGRTLAAGGLLKSLGGAWRGVEVVEAYASVRLEAVFLRRCSATNTAGSSNMRALMAADTTSGWHVTTLSRQQYSQNTAAPACHTTPQQYMLHVPFHTDNAVNQAHACSTGAEPNTDSSPTHICPAAATCTF